MADIRVLVVDDSVVIRRLLADLIDGEADMTTVSTASNGKLAVEKAIRLEPDVITLDVEMPVLDGLGALRELRAAGLRVPVIMFSTMTERGATATLDAMALGAADYVTKPANTGGFEASKQRVRDELLPKIRGLAAPARAPRRPSVAAAPASAGAATAQCIAVGCSTGGPNALAELLPLLTADLTVPVVITQHMPPIFTGLLAKRLDAASALTVVEAEDGQLLEPGHVYIAPGDHHMGLAGSPAAGVTVALDQDAPVNSCRPAVDAMFRAAARVYGKAVLGVVLTGMGQDGVEGARAIKAAGGQVLVQDSATSVVWGMPGAVHEQGLADAVLALREIPRAVQTRLRHRSAVGGSAV